LSDTKISYFFSWTKSGYLGS